MPWEILPSYNLSETCREIDETSEGNNWIFRKKTVILDIRYPK